MIKEHKIQLKTVKIESKPIMIYIASYENKEIYELGYKVN